MKVIRLKIMIITYGVGFLLFFGLLVFVALFISNDDDSSGGNYSDMEGGGSVSVSADVLKHRSTVEKYAKEYSVSEYVSTLLAIMEVESGGKLIDVMQSSESMGLPPNTLDSEEASIKQGVKYFADLIQSAESKGVDGNTVIQAYNYGGGFIDYVAQRGKQYSFDLAQSFAKEQSGGSKTTYSNPIAVKKNGGWRYLYGNMFYVDLVNQFFHSPQFDGDLVQQVMDEALKYEGYPYVFGGDNPNTSFDCSGLTQWSYQKVGIDLPRTAQQQYDFTEHIPLSEAKPGDLVFFHSTYNSGTYVTHVGIYLGDNQMYNAGDPIGYADLTTAYWQKHLIGAGRIKQ